MEYPYPLLVSQLQFYCSPEEYQTIVKPFSNWVSTARHGVPYGIPRYWQIMPKYLYARCPMCGTEYREPVNTYNFASWGGFHILKNGFYIEQGQYERYCEELTRCSHFLGVTVFCNLHNQPLPQLKEWINHTGEVPFLTSALLPDDLESYAVLHALPICQTLNNQFVPTYTVFAITYFSESPKLVRASRIRQEWERGKNDPEFFPAELEPPGTPSNLAAFAQKGRLGWLDLTSADYGLRIGRDEQLPEMYQYIPGRLKPYSWQRPD
jgi:hypothetical protein